MTTFTGLLVFFSIVYVSGGQEVTVEVSCDKVCRNGGSCEVRVDSSTGQFIRQCVCPPAYTGELCEDYLVQVTCDKACVHGSCDVIVGPETNDEIPFSLKCVCEPNYHDEFCAVFQEKPTCDPPCVDGHGACILLENSRLAPHLQDHAYCNCSATPTGFYYGKTCAYEETYGCSQPCLNGGICEVVGDRGHCKCSRNSTGSFSGSDCSQFYEDCNPPCLNGGTCYSGSFCSCSGTSDGEFSGRQCETFNITCDPPCLNGGTCYYGSCSCSSTHEGYYSGSKCENFTKYSDPDRECNPACVNGNCKYGWCNCWTNSTVRYKGNTCEQIIRKSDPCPAPCQNGGVCEFGFCRCTPTSSHYYYGSSCEISTECQCINGGNCTYGGKCVCPIRYTGDNCETFLNDCPCENGGTCDVDWKSCRCRGNETHYIAGQRCKEVYKSYCFPVALNGGWCINVGPKSYLCPYDDHGYFYRDQCLQYKSNADCNCSEPKVCYKDECTCPFSLEERFETIGDNCESKLYV